MENSPCGLALLAPDGKFLFANRGLLELLDQKENSVFDLRFQDVVPPGGRIFYETQFLPSLLMRGALDEISFDLMCSGERRVPIFVNAVLWERSDGDKGILLAVFKAEQRRMYENELLRARKQFEQIADLVRRSSDAILRLDADGLIQTWNNGAEQVFGFSAAEIAGKPLWTLFAESAQADMEAALPRLRKGQESLTETIGLQKDGGRIEVSINLTPHMEAPGVLVAFSAVIRDITSRKLAERALIQNEKLASVGRLASSIAHEINNPLESVTNLLYLLESNVSDAEGRALVALAQEELARVSQIATQTLRFHKQSSSRTELDPSRLTDSVLALYRARLQDAGIIVLNDSEGASPLLCFEGELRQVLVNLVSNAFDSMRHGGRLIVRNRDVLSPAGEPGVRITVADTGTGMDAETLVRIFEPFFSTKGIGGTGLGLWIVKGLVQKNNGTIKLRSCTKPGRSGTVVMMHFRRNPAFDMNSKIA